MSSDGAGRLTATELRSLILQFTYSRNVKQFSYSVHAAQHTLS